MKWFEHVEAMKMIQPPPPDPITSISTIGFCMCHLNRDQPFIVLTRLTVVIR